MTGFFKGTATALVTPFCAEGVNKKVLKELISAQIEGGANAIVVLGTTGEPSTMTERERDEAISCAVEAAEGKLKVIVGTGSNDQARAVRSTKRAEALGADGALAVTPYYNRCTQQGLCDYYRALTEASALPVIAYNVPARTGVNLLPETAERISYLPNLAGIKEASGNMAQILEILRAVRGRCDVFCGDDALILPVLACGGAGVISVVSNLAPGKISELVRAAMQRESRAAELSSALLPLVKACFLEVNPIPVKEGLKFLGFEVGDPRPPLTPLSAGAREILIREMTVCGPEGKA